MSDSQIYLLISIFGFIVIIAAFVFIAKKKCKRPISPLVGLALAFIISASVFDNRIIAYSLIGVGVMLAAIDIIRNSKDKKDKMHKDEKQEKKTLRPTQGDSDESKNKKYPEGYFVNQWMAIGISIGVAFGIPLGNIALGIPIGVGVGVAIGAGVEQRYKEKGLIRPMTDEEKKCKKRNVFVAISILLIVLIALLTVFFVSR